MGYEEYQRTYNPSLYGYTPFEKKRRPKFGTSRKELLHLAIATAALTLALVLWFESVGELFKFELDTLNLFGKILLAFAVASSGFVLHELGHKFTAQHFGHWSEFRVWWGGLVLAILSAYLLGILIAAPGATWHTASGRQENGKVSAMGPLINVFVMFIAFLFTLGRTREGDVGANIAAIVVFFNGVLALFNLIPLGPLDGKKVLKWNPIYYFALVGLAIAAFVWTGAAFVIR